MRFTNKEIKCIIGGTGEEKEYLERKVGEYNLANRIKLIGFVSDQKLIELYSNALGVYFAPYDEDYGYVTLEALLWSGCAWMWWAY